MPMGMEHRLEARLEQRLRLSPRIIQSIEILQLPLLALEERVEQELLENPVLELSEEQPGGEGEESEGEDGSEEQAGEEGDEDGAGELAGESAAEAGEADEIVPEEPDDFEGVEELVTDWEDFYTQTRTVAAGDGPDPKLEALQNTAQRPVSLDEYLLSQLRLGDLSPEIQDMAERIIYSLDKSGYLNTPLEELFSPLLPLAADDQTRARLLSQAEEALRFVQSLDPAGVGARDLGECLLLQVTDELPSAELVRELLRHHLKDLLQNRLPAVAEATGRSLEELNGALDALAHLDPRPGMVFSHDLVPNVLPELTVRYREGRYRVSLNEGDAPGLYIRKDYRDLLRRRDTDPKLREFIKKKIQSAQWLMDAIEQRRRTISRVAQAIVDRQQEFMELGEGHLKPLKMQEVADEVGVHVATVSRAVSGKYVDTHHGIYELRSFFTGGTITAEGAEESWENVKQRIADLVKEEDKQKPLSDQAVADCLKEEGIHVARRTVTKYRKELHIPSARLRRQYRSIAQPPSPEPYSPPPLSPEPLSDQPEDPP